MAEEEQEKAVVDVDVVDDAPPPEAAVGTGVDAAAVTAAEKTTGGGGKRKTIAEQAREEFESPNNKYSFDKTAPPIIIENLTILKDFNETKKKKNAGGPTSSAATATATMPALETAPNFVTAMLGQWTATKLGCGTPPPPASTSTSTSAANSSSSTLNQRHVLKNINALLLPGEVTLLLGPSSSGKSTLMKTIRDACEDGGYCGNHNRGGGNNGSSTEEPSTTPMMIRLLHDERDRPKDTIINNNNNGSKLFPRSAAYSDQGDLSLTPTLTVKETIEFARRCAEGIERTTPESIQKLFELVGLDHVQQTVVGNADIRGVSGGQKRRVKVLEQAVGDQVVCLLLDEITNGLDAASAYQVCQVVRTSLEVFHHTGITSLLQPSQAVFETFHRLILLTPHGEVAYSGPTTNAMEHFSKLGLSKPEGLSDPEFLLQCAADPAGMYMSNHADAENCDIQDVPDDVQTPSALAKAFPSSSAGQALKNETEQLLSGQHPVVQKRLQEKDQSKVDSSSSSSRVPQFALSTVQQIMLLMGRGFKLVVRNPVSMMRVVSAIIIGLIIGTLFLNTANDADGTRIRSGYLLCLLFISFLNSSMAGLEDLYADRITFYVHRDASFYRTASYYISNILYNLPVAWLEAGLLAMTSYFLVGMSGGAAEFFLFLVLFLCVALAGSAIGRCLAYALPTADMAQSLGPAFLMLFILTTGQSPQYRDVPVWLRWLAWLSPTAYAYEGCVVNELNGRTVLVTSLTGDTEEVPGSVYGEQTLGVPRIPYGQAPAALSTESGVIAFDIYMLIVIWFAFEVFGFSLLCLSRKWYGPSTKRYQVVSGMSLAAPPPDWLTGVGKKKKKKKENATVPDAKADDDYDLIPKAPQIHLTARNIVYEVDIPIIEETKDDKKAPVVEEKETEKDIDMIDSDEAPLLTAREYGQTGRGKASEWLISKRLGEDAIHNHRTSSIRSNAASSGSKRSSEADPTMELEPPAPGRLRLLSGITASFEPGTMTALMGSSGAGKTTLLDVLAGYKTGGHISGDIRLNGHEKTDTSWRAIAGYCEQVDLHNPMMTCRESLLFSARLRLKMKPGVSSEDADAAKAKFCEKLLDWLDLTEFADILVGDEASGEGLPKHARKRLTVGVEWASNCSILFADEPTSGLDSSSTAVVVAALQRAVQQGLTVVCTIHQPSRSVFESFDNLLLLRKGGVCVYQGAINKISSYIESIAPQLKMERDGNPADHVLEVFCGNNDDTADWPQRYQSSSMFQDAVESFNAGDSSPGEDVTAIVSTLAKVPWSVQFYHVLMRSLLAHWRTPSYMAIRLWWTIVSNLIVGLVFLGAGKDKNSPNGIQNVLGALFFFVNVATVPLLSAVVPLVTERAVFYRETFSGTYGKGAYGWAVQLAEVPFNLSFALVAWLIFYFTVGLSLEGDRIIYFILMALAAYWWLPAAGQLLAFLSPNIGSAVGLGSLLLTLMQLTMGFLIPANAIPPWYIWVYWINPLRYIQQGLTVNEVGGRPVGDLLLEQLTWSFDTRWWYCYVAVLLFAIGTAIGIVYSTRISWLKR